MADPFMKCSQFRCCREMLLLSVLVTLISAAIGISIDPVVDTPLGQLRGYRLTSRSGRQFLAFSGVPYAKPPLDHLRFQAPEPVTAWEGIKDATKDGPMCTQFANSKSTDVIGEEDCLYLSVFTKNISESVPVLVHFHGGSYVSGDESLFGTDYLVDEGIVIVKVNYRLNIFGFLALESPELPGNQGVKDQLMALRWVQQNIASFGGNPNLVTIIGESAGGASVFNHIISPLSKGLFHRVVSESGTSYGTWAVAKPGYRRYATMKLLEALGCPTNAENAVTCISAMDASNIMKISANLAIGTLPFGPVIEAPGPNSFIVGLPNEWQHNSVPLLIGTDSEEGILFTSAFTAKDFDFTSFAKNFNKNLPYLLGYTITASDPDQVTKQIRKFYLDKDEFTLEEDFDNLTRIFSDIFFTVPILEGADRHTGDVYFYYFDKKIPVPGVDDKYITGAMHTAETRYLWNTTKSSYYPRLLDQDDIELSKQLVKIVGTFVKTGVPVIEGSNLEWKRWTKDNHNYIQIDKEGFHLKKGLAEDRYSFWKSINYKDKFWGSS